jgi:hypothetical protein
VRVLGQAGNEEIRTIPAEGRPVLLAMGFLGRGPGMLEQRGSRSIRAANVAANVQDYARPFPLFAPGHASRAIARGWAIRRAHAPGDRRSLMGAHLPR